MALIPTQEEQISRLKLELMDRYVILMIFILSVFTINFIFHIPDKITSSYLICGILFLGCGYTFVRKKYPQNMIVHTYMILAPIYCIYIIVSFWDSSVANFCWLLPLPLGAHIFFSKKAVIIYTVYALMTIFIATILVENLTIKNYLEINFPKYNTRKEVIFTDTLVFISNILVISLFIYYKDKIKKQELLESLTDIKTNLKIEDDEEEIGEKDIKSLPDSIDIASMERLFERIESAMQQKMLFKDVKFNLSKLSASLDVNSAYISKAIRYKGYPNLNTYLNIYRINYVKKLFKEIDFQKATLMYIYTEAGFSNQSTFNRVFKQIEGITPSEYIQQNL
ncbi:AraC family transcriptional regulator [Chryseobacterium indologenes]|nr:MULTISPECIES: AraC family transcriptional regulator [Chryseobacterium]MDM1553617.1 helix-turn-helix transcriptional regulator [Chryseobacterium indologenes]WET48412.1 AraC family transcriptional regulator [Chryseobacterium indologenes]